VRRCDEDHRVRRHGRTGRHLLAEGRRRGHQLTAFTRRPDALADPAALAGVVVGDARDPAAVRKAVDGAEAVISTIAPERRKGPYPVADATAAIAEAMADLGVRRLIVTSPYGMVADRPARGRFRTSGELFATGPYPLARADAAAALLDVAEGGAFARTAINLAAA
jgi:nucleoside-diphosphate-sugar epimerase